MDKLHAKPLATQVAGRHKSVSTSQSQMLDIGEGYVLKATQAPPRGPREIEFYKTVFEKTEDKTILALRPFLPHFYSTVVYDDVVYMKLENVTATFKKPSVMDVKIGAMSWDPEAADAKINQEKGKFPPAQKVGFRFAGMRVYNQGKESFEFLGKDYCYSLTEDAILDKGFGRFFTQGSDIQRKPVKVILNKLKDIEKWILSQKRFSFYCSSLLLVYESSSIQEVTVRDQDTATSDLQSVLADVRMIDFAHVFPSKQLDENYLHGLRNVISFLTTLLES